MPHILTQLSKEKETLIFYSFIYYNGSELSLGTPKKAKELNKYFLSAEGKIIIVS